MRTFDRCKSRMGWQSSDMKDRILAAVGSPKDLEGLYRKSPKEFATALREAFDELPDSCVLQVWHERLFFDEMAAGTSAAKLLYARDIWLTVALSLIAGTLAKLPILLPISRELFYPRNLCGIMAGALTAYFCIQKPCRGQVTAILLSILAGSLLFLNLLPDRSNSASILMACIYAPFVFWSLLGIAFAGGHWSSLGARMDYLRYNGELLIYTTMILLGGMVLTGLTAALFHLIGLDISEWYMSNVVVYGAVAAPVVATLLIDRVVGDRFKITPLLAKIFTPLFLVTVVAYLIAMIFQHRSPFTDRDFLIAFNLLLLVVLGLCVFSVSERGRRDSAGVTDLMNIALVFVTLLIDVVALSAIVFRTASEGLTPNRMAVLGANLLIFLHLAGILFHYIRFIRKSRDFDAIENWIVAYLPAYTAWSLFVMVGFPLLFWFR